MFTDSLTIRIAQRLPLTVVVLDGTLTQQGAERLRQVMLKCLTDCPDAVVVDLAGLSADSDLPLAIFGAVNRHAAVWPAVPVLLCAPSPALSDRLARLGMDRSLPVFRDRGAALAAAVRAPTIARADQRLPHSTQAPEQARNLVVEVCMAWDLPELVDAARLIVSELVTNAVIHADSPPHVTVVLRHPYLHLVIRDDSPRPPAKRVPTPPDQVAAARSGWGLQLVDVTAHSWGYVPDDNGKAVWATLRCASTASPPYEAATHRADR